MAEAGKATSGVLLVDKPAGMTSHDVVARVRHLQGIRKVGHAGTLDPFATGLLIILVGRATRLQRYLLGLPKTYVATARLGWTSSTGDPDGELTETGELPTSLELPTGQITQKLPLTSAVKVDGERLYKKAHRGEDFDTPEREVEIYRADRLESGENEAVFEVECSSGTYIRTLVETLGDAYCSQLRRTAIGDVGLDQAIDLEQAGGPLLSVAAVLGFMHQVMLSDEEAKIVSNGGWIPREDDLDGAACLVHEDSVIAIAQPEPQRWQPEVVLA